MNLMSFIMKSSTFL